MSAFVPTFLLDGAEVDPADVPPDRLHDVVATTPDGPVRLFRFLARADDGDALVPDAPTTRRQETQ